MRESERCRGCKDARSKSEELSRESPLRFGRGQGKRGARAKEWACGCAAQWCSGQVCVGSGGLSVIRRHDLPAPWEGFSGGAVQYGWKTLGNPPNGTSALGVEDFPALAGLAAGVKQLVG